MCSHYPYAPNDFRFPPSLKIWRSAILTEEHWLELGAPAIHSLFCKSSTWGPCKFLFVISCTPLERRNRKSMLPRDHNILMENRDIQWFSLHYHPPHFLTPLSELPTMENKDCIDIYCNKPLSWKIMVNSLRRRAIISAPPLPTALSAECNLHYRTKTEFSKTLQGTCDYNGVESFATDSHFSGWEALGLYLDKSC